MNLTGYSDSEDSGDDLPQVPQPAVKPAPKATFQKVVDRSNPGKIKLNLPSASQPQQAKDDIESEAPPAKRARIGGGAFSGFNAMLPAPKKPKLEVTIADAPSGKRGLGKGLGVGVNLKTGAEPAFRREAKTELEDYDEDGNPIKKEVRKQEDFRALLNLPPPKSETKLEETPKPQPVSVEIKPSESVSQPVARPRFMPIGMARGKKKKPAAKPVVTASAASSSNPVPNAPSSAPAAEQKPPVKQKVSLFSVAQEVNVPQNQPTSEYEPLLYGADQDTPEISNSYSSYQPHEHPTASTTQQPQSAPNTLTNIASELSLTASERRQLFGRKNQGPDLSSAKIVDFNTDTEYAHNELLRQQGETVQHNALKSISGTGKNSLRSLINVANTQKDALEEHFASGRRNKKEAGNKYGW